MRCIQIDQLHPDPAVLAEAGAVIRSGGLVAFPTETVYGLGANALEAAAVARIFQAKQRPANDPIIVHLADGDDLGKVVSYIPGYVEDLAHAFWPGPLTLVLPKADEIPLIVTSGGDTVGVRVPWNAVADGLIRAAGVPIAAPSANRFSRTSATTAQHVIDDLGDAVDLILDGGPTMIGIESTVVACDGMSVRVLRPGAVSAERIGAVLRPGVAVLEGARHGSESPGLQVKHYAPRAPMTLLTGPGSRHRLLELAASSNEPLGILAPSEDVQALEKLGRGHLVEDLGPDVPSAVRSVYAAMRRLDARGSTTIIARTVGTGSLSAALTDRMTRAASGNVIHVA